MAQTKFAGIAFLLKLGSDDSPPVFTTVAGQRTTSLSINNEQIDTTDKDDSRWRKLMEGGVRSMSSSAAGLITGQDAFKTLMNIALQGSIKTYQLVFADGQTLEGPFQVSSKELTGEYTDAQQYTLSLESAGDIDYSEFESA